MSELIFQDFDTTTVPESELLKLFSLYDVLRKERDPMEPALPLELRIKSARDPNPYSKFDKIVAYTPDKEKIIAQATLSYQTENAPSYEENKHICQIEIQVHPEHRGKGIAKELLKRMLVLAKGKESFTRVYANSYHHAGKKFCEQYGGKAVLEGSENRLIIENVNWDLINEWREKGQTRGKEEGISIQLFEECPDDIIDEFTEVYTETINQQPLGDFDGRIVFTPETRRVEEKRNKDKNIEWYTMITREKDGAISGLTEIFYHQQIPHKAFQNLTGVREQYRGRGLGKWLKAEMLLFITKKYPQIKYISTGNATTNAPMLSINKRMGFKEFISDTTYSFDLEVLAQRF